HWAEPVLDTGLGALLKRELFRRLAGAAQVLRLDSDEAHPWPIEVQALIQRGGGLIDRGGRVGPAGQRPGPGDGVEIRKPDLDADGAGNQGAPAQPSADLVAEPQQLRAYRREIGEVALVRVVGADRLLDLVRIHLARID